MITLQVHGSIIIIWDQFGMIFIIPLDTFNAKPTYITTLFFKILHDFHFALDFG